MNILIIDDEKEACDNLSNFVKKFNHDVNVSYDGKDALDKIKNDNFDLIISDVNLPFYSGIDIVKKVKEKNNNTQVILISGMEDIIQSINAIELGIMDFLAKPIDIKKLASLINNADKVMEDFKKKTKDGIFFLNEKKLLKLDTYQFSEDYSIYNDFMGQIGIFSSKMFSIYKKLKKLEEYQNIPVLIEGETGTGKEIIAKYIHYENPGNKGIFIGINCSTLEKELFDAELFGYEKGSFTGADAKGKEGKIKAAENGTLFLDEITELSTDLQAKLLRVIQEREYYKIGSHNKEIVNTRIIAATNKDIEKEVEQKLFREDLYHRLNICKVIIPPLRERKEEIIPLTVFFIQTIGKELGKKIDSIETDALKLLIEYNWPGNIRELKNQITKIILFSDGIILTKDMVEQFFTAEKRTTNKLNIDPNNIEIPKNPFNLDELNQVIIKKTLEKFNGNKTKTAEFLGLTRIQLYGRFK
jgi:two-component system, NtrC family, response regulator AtoC